MAISLYPHQQELFWGVREAAREHKKILMHGPCGVGKTRIAAALCQKAKRALFLVHQQELCLQTSESFHALGLDHGLIMAGSQLCESKIQVGMIQTVARRLHMFEAGTLPMPTLVFIDECHRAGSKTYLEIIDFFSQRGALIVGGTGTVSRTDGKGLKIAFDHLIKGPNERWLIDNGYLSDYKIFYPPQPDFSKVKIKRGDYDQDEAARIMMRPQITGDAITHYKRHAYGKKFVVMCSNVTQAHADAEAFTEAGFPCKALDGTMSREERDAIVKAYQSNELLGLAGCNLLVEGFDCAWIECIVIRRKSKSLIFHKQSIARAMRPWPGKTHCVILDHAGNTMDPELGMPDQEHDWTLEDKIKQPRKSSKPAPPPVSRCPKCRGEFTRGARTVACPYCSTDLPGGPAGAEVVEGDLIELSPEEAKAFRKNELKSARTLAALVDVFDRQGSKNPPAAAAFRYAARQGRKVNIYDIVEAEKCLKR